MVLVYGVGPDATNWSIALITAALCLLPSFGYTKRPTNVRKEESEWMEKVWPLANRVENALSRLHQPHCPMSF
ncbi:hypothetical protein BLOT_009522, partial [Blomia tropicalis]